MAQRWLLNSFAIACYHGYNALGRNESPVKTPVDADPASLEKRPLSLPGAP
jgi:hypothetical protein